ncbi:hypothetical protein L6164_007218 [Bauhinia variegata]|uniref:Uncharacterized protein n=1 Tax=Bauhinia variegata TaxID=167791 RepID=A0ACB9PCT8_BAUVA|nr:hypothetical protein L6164_007218 [Bauhinia variegata]
MAELTNNSNSFNMFKSLLLVLFLLLNPPAIITGGYPRSRHHLVLARPLQQDLPNYVNFKPKKGDGRTEFRACLPKGFRLSSAPSRYINYQPLGSTCFSGKVLNNAP